MENSYFKSHPMYAQGIKSSTSLWNIFSKFDDEIWKFLKSLPRDAKILEIGYWKWDFAMYCNKRWFKNYTWIEIDNTFEAHNKERFPEYSFSTISISDFFKENSWFDVIFMAHVFEHLDEDEADKTVSMIYSALNTWWYWINYMPNADSQKACALRYIDITHKKIYNTHSFEQIFLANDAGFSNIYHFNTLPSISPMIKFIFKIIHPIFLLLTKFYYTGMWLLYPKIYSSELLSVMKK